jgi:hypothetical protein
MTDIILRLIAAGEPPWPKKKSAETGGEPKPKAGEDHPVGGITNPDQSPGEAMANFANMLTRWLEKSRYASYIDQMRGPEKRPFARFFRYMGLEYDEKNHEWVDNGGAREHALYSRPIILEFAFQYARVVHDPRSASPYYLTQASEALNDRLQEAVQALSLDINELFIAPTLERIRKRKRDHVDYAQVGKTTLAALSGLKASVTAEATSAVEIPPVIRLSDLLTSANDLSKQASPFIPKVPVPGAAAGTTQEAMIGGMPASQLIGLIGAFGEQKSIWRTLTTGISLEFTPDVLRNQTSSQLHVKVTYSNADTTDKTKGARPLSMIGSHGAETDIYIKALDIFDLSTFASQTTVTGERGYVPVIGPIWKGIFGEVPVLGDFFNWQRPAKNVYHQSLIMSNAIITPTAIGVALLYPIDIDPLHRNPCPRPGKKAEKGAEQPMTTMLAEETKTLKQYFDVLHCQIENYQNDLKETIKEIRRGPSQPSVRASGRC